MTGNYKIERVPHLDAGRISTEIRGPGVACLTIDGTELLAEDIARALGRAYRAGQEAKAAELCAVLGIARGR
jgi:hypothetical protein